MAHGTYDILKLTMRQAIVTLSSVAAIASAAHIQHDIRAGRVKSHGVNLGGWLVAENWMTTGAVIWQGVPQTTATGELNKGRRDSNNIENDIRQISLANLNTVRVPVGFWIQGCDHLAAGVLKDHCNRYAKGGLDYLDKLIRDWAWKHNVAHPRRSKNPESVDTNVLMQCYRDAYKAVRAVSDCVLTHVPLLSHQKPGHGTYMDDFAPEMTNVWHEWHSYVIWTYESMTEDQLINQGVAGRVNGINNWKGKPLFLGEWSFVMPGSTFSDMNRFGQLASRMMGMFKGAKSGWAYWTWKKANDDKSNLDKWSLRSVLKLANSFTPTANEKATAIYDSNGKSLTTRTDAWRLVNDKTWVAEVGRAREWWYDSKAKTLRSNLDGQCLDGYPTQNGQFAVHAYACAAGNQNQVWTLSNCSIIQTNRGSAVRPA
ncbi:hypothetical protein AC1031_006383 [Aphanomyces cochlioides]|nr:hypothetical protein AC1031_006383 [Aphanomyces cochlioides]